MYVKIPANPIKQNKGAGTIFFEMLLKVTFKIFKLNRSQFYHIAIDIITF